MAESLRTYIYVHHHKNVDRNGNPRDSITVYRMKRNIPHLLGEPKHDVGYRGEEQAVCDVILENEAGWGRRYQGLHGMNNPVADAVSNTRSESYQGATRVGNKRAKLHRVGG